MRYFIISLFFLSLLGCQSNQVVNNSFLQKRKYRKGFHISKAERHTHVKPIQNKHPEQNKNQLLDTVEYYVKENLSDSLVIKDSTTQNTLIWKWASTQTKSILEDPNSFSQKDFLASVEKLWFEKGVLGDDTLYFEPKKNKKVSGTDIQAAIGAGSATLSILSYIGMIFTAAIQINPNPALIAGFFIIFLLGALSAVIFGLKTVRETSGFFRFCSVFAMIAGFVILGILTVIILLALLIVLTGGL